jgi:hypothetical protein
MSKGNLFLGMARGKVGDVVFARQNGEQVTRARNRAPKNPQTPLQLLQRVILKTASGAYSLLQDIADHSFQGEREGTPNQSVFMKRNVALLRTKCADEINSGDPEAIVTSLKANFSDKASSLAEINAYQVSEGSIVPVTVEFTNGVFCLALPGMAAGITAPTYQNMVDALGIQQGDQLTFLVLTKDDRLTAPEEMEGKFNGLLVARIIMEPALGDMTMPFLDGTAVNSPNERNEGQLTLSLSGSESAMKLVFNNPGAATAAEAINTVVAAAVIVSRNTNGDWLRSTQSLVLRPTEVGTQGALTEYMVDYLGDGVVSYMSEAQSSLYLNQSRSF